MRRLLKRWWSWVVVLLLVGLAVNIALIYFRQGQITQANCDKIKDGMTEKEVEDILGGPEGDHTGWPQLSFPVAPAPEYWKRDLGQDDEYTLKIWAGEEGYSAVTFRYGKVYHFVFWRRAGWYDHRAKRIWDLLRKKIASVF